MTKLYSLVLLSLLGLSAVNAADTTTTVEVTPTITATTTVSVVEQIYETEYIYTNGDGVLTTETIIVSGSPPATTDAATPTTTASTSPTSNLFADYTAPPGDYSTATETKTTVLDSGVTAVYELVVLYTTVCPC
ncbi:predicted protein [Scheffersomyces stipitis CBS 6054]|uniref:Uncharacterized protein n=1 Tax=Scheffersomyces stipitis (strain ATCC 58785 / CBS 6054 / NBRC 10063 / NRRL Y-11545) TaxID=322104 RepID=A3LPQ7_PICST|nr:predicted protein [Scheffersomyces stipitis CBS 6054]ABN65082.1 predicted protein [Scheffersomyces stipitis CBS 6054]